MLLGLSDPVLDSQRIFRAVLDAMARPGRVVSPDFGLMPPAPLHPACAGIALALLDYETPVWLESDLNPEARGYLSLHCGCPITDDPAKAAFALISRPATMPPLARFNIGSDSDPDRSTTLLIQLDSLRDGQPWRLRGPGVLGPTAFAPLGLPPEFRRWVGDNQRLFPCGVDLIFICGADLTAIPRSTRLED